MTKLSDLDPIDPHLDAIGEEPPADDSDLMPPAETFSLDFLMSKLPAELTDQDLDAIIQYHRNIRADRATGTRKVKVSTAQPTEGLAKMLKPKATVTINRRGL